MMRKEIAFRRNPFQTQQPLVVLTFDDGIFTDYSIAFNEMRRRGLNGTSYIVPNFIGEPGYLAWDVLKRMKESGWDLQCHTTTHRNMANLSEQELYDEMLGVNAEFESQGLETPDHHAYPFGSTNDQVKSIFSEFRKTLRLIGVENQINDYDDIDFHALKACRMETESDLPNVKSKIDEAIAGNKVLILFGHRITKQNPNPSFTIQYDRFLEILDYIIEKGVRVVTLNEMHEKVKPVVS